MTELFTDGKQGSRQALVAEFERLRTEGQTILDQLETARQDVLLTMEQALAELNGKRQRVNRLMSSNILGRFVVSDFFGIDQPNTTATVRADSQSISLQERKRPFTAAVRSIRFTPSAGIVEQAGNTYRVFSETGIPTGAFEVEFAAPVTANMAVFDILSMPSEFAIEVSTSENAVQWTPAFAVSRNGYRVTAWLETQAAKYLRIKITPTHPDTLGGKTYTFGITSFAAQNVDFHLRSDVVLRPIDITPWTRQIKLRGDEDENISYFLSFDGQAFFEAKPGQLITVPGASAVSLATVPLDAQGQLQHILDDNAYLPTLRVLSMQDTPVRIAPGLPINQTVISNPYIAVNGNTMHLRPFEPALQLGEQFQVSYICGPPVLRVWLRIRLSSDDNHLTPVFHGAHLESA